MPVRVALLAPASILLLPGCGKATEVESQPLDGLSTAQVLKRAKAAAHSASSVHFVAHIVESGDEPVDLDVHISGADASGTLGVKGKNLKVRLVGQDVYLQGDHQFWVDSAGAEVAKLLDGKWLKGSTSEPKLKGFVDLVSLDPMIDELLAPEGALERVKGRTIDGQESVGLHDSGTSGDGTLYVANAEKAYPLLVVPDPGSDKGGRAEFSDWDRKVTVSAPPADQVVDADKLAS